MTREELNIQFKAAYARTSRNDVRLPPDIMLLLYAYYKLGTGESNLNRVYSGTDIRSAFKQNALLQARGITRTEAKELYIDLVEKYLPKS